MQRGLKAASQTACWAYKPCSLNAKRIESARGRVDVTAKWYWSQCKEDWKAIPVFIWVIIRGLVSMQRGLKVEYISFGLSKLRHCLNAKRIESKSRLVLPVLSMRCLNAKRIEREPIPFTLTFQFHQVSMQRGLKVWLDCSNKPAAWWDVSMQRGLKDQIKVVLLFLLQICLNAKRIERRVKFTAGIRMKSSLNAKRIERVGYLGYLIVCCKPVSMQRGLKVYQ